jgi:hypothetical protein
MLCGFLEGRIFVCGSALTSTFARRRAEFPYFCTEPELESSTKTDPAFVVTSLLTDF